MARKNWAESTAVRAYKIVAARTSYEGWKIDTVGNIFTRVLEELVCVHLFLGQS